MLERKEVISFVACINYKDHLSGLYWIPEPNTNYLKLLFSRAPSSAQVKGVDFASVTEHEGPSYLQGKRCLEKDVEEFKTHHTICPGFSHPGLPHCPKWPLTNGFVLRQHFPDLVL